MINNIYFDLDETLIHTECYSFPQQTHSFFLEDYGDHYLALHPQALEAVAYARDVVGKDNVYILTVAVRPYAHEINEICNLGFDEDHIFSREDLELHKIRSSMGYVSVDETTPHITAHKNNLLIDNRLPRENGEKIGFIGIWKTFNENYLNVKDYWGVNFPDDPFLKEVKEFIDRHKNS